MSHTRFYYYPISTETTIAAYVNRHVPKILRKYNREYIKRSGRHLVKFKCVCQPMSKEMYCESMPTSHKRNQYNDALARLRSGAKVSSKVRPFTKLKKSP